MKNSLVLFAKSILCCCILLPFVFLCFVGVARGEVVEIPNGTLEVDKILGTPGVPHALAVLGPGFDISNEPLIFNATLDPSQTNGGVYGMGLVVGDLWFMFHPGFPSGAFRIDMFTTTQTFAGPVANNQNMGFNPNGDPATFTVTVTQGGGQDYVVDVEITQNSDSYHPAPFSFAGSEFGENGVINQFGVAHNRFLNSQNLITADYTNVQATSNAKVVLGDVNLDGEVNLLDVPPFVDLLTTSGYQTEADINQDGAVDLLDVEPFVDLLSGG